MKSYLEQRNQETPPSWLECSTRLLQEFGISAQEGQAFYFHNFGALDFSVLLGVYLHAVRKMGRTEFLIPQGERESLTTAAAAFEGTVAVKRLMVNDSGLIEPDTLQEMIRLRTALFACSLVHPISGVIQPLDKLLQICHEVDVPTYVDITHAVGFWGGELQHTDIVVCDFSVLSSIVSSFQESALPEDSEVGGGLVWIRGGGLVDMGPLRGIPLPGVSKKVHSVLLKVLELKMPFQLQLPTVGKAFVERVQELCSGGTAPEGVPVGESSFGLLGHISVHFFMTEAQVSKKVLLGFPDVHGDLLRYVLLQEFQVEVEGGSHLRDYLISTGIHPSLAASAICITFSGKDTKQEAQRLAETIVQAANQVVCVGGGLCI